MGAFGAAVCSMSERMRATSVRAPVAVTTARPRPLATTVPENSIDVRSGEGGVSRHGVRAFPPGLTFTRERRLVAGETVGLEDAGIGGHDVARLTEEDVAGHQLGGRDHRHPSRRARRAQIPPRARARRRAGFHCDARPRTRWPC